MHLKLCQTATHPSWHIEGQAAGITLTRLVPRMAGPASQPWPATLTPHSRRYQASCWKLT